MNKFIFTTTLGIAFLLATGLVAVPQTLALKDIELLGKYVFFDKISSPSRMACVTCHQPDTGGTGGVSGVNLHQVAITGANPHTAGSLKPPSNAYATFIVPFEANPAFPTGFRGGAFWNGRSEGRDPFVPPFPGAAEHIGDEVFDTPTQQSLYGQFLGPVADQALNPFGNLVEQNINRQGVCLSVASAKYAPLFQKVWGEPIDCSASGLNKSFKRIAVSLAAWQSSSEVNSFSSKRDIALKGELDGIDIDSTPGAFPLVGLTAQENRGHELFYNTILNPNFSLPITNCALCHSDNPGPPPFGDTGLEPDQTYADSSYHNIGVPPNPEIAGYPVLNEGLAGHTGNPFHLGTQKTPTLRNVDKRPGKGFTKAYTHNGWFKSLESIVHFYNTAFLGGPIPFPPFNIPYEATTAYTFGVKRCPEGIETEKDALANNCWPAPEFDSSSSPLLAIGIIIGDMHLTPEDEAAIVAYLKTFTDTFTPKQPNPYK